MALLNCSANPPFDGVYLAWIARKPSAKVCTPVVKVVNVEVEEAYVPAATDDENWRKNASDVLVTVKEPCCFQTISAS